MVWRMARRRWLQQRQVGRRRRAAANAPARFEYLRGQQMRWGCMFVVHLALFSVR